MEPSTKNSWDEALLHLPAYQKYEQFDSVEISKETISECNALKSNDAGDKTLCKKVAQNLKKLSTLPDDELKSGCYYFQHWFFDNIAKKYYNGNKQGNNYNVAKELFNIVLIFTSKLPKIKPCYCYESGSPDVWKKEKYFHTYFENHKDIKCNDSDKSKCEKYVNYVTYIKNLYENKRDDCCEDEELWIFSSCGHYFNCKNKYNPEDLLTKLQKELQSAGKITEAPRDRGTGAVEAGKAPTSGGEEPEKKAQKDEVAAGTTEKVIAGEVPTEKTENSLAQPASAKSVAVKFVPPEPKKTLAEEAVADEEADGEEAGEEEEGEEEGPEEVVNETMDALQPEEPLGTPPIESTEQDVHAISSYTTEITSNAVPLTITDSTKTLGTTHEELDSNFFRNVIMAIAVLGTILFLFYYNRSSRLESSSRKKKRKKAKNFEHNYYEEYQKELAMYDSEETFLDSETDRLYLNYHADQDSYY